MALSSTGPSAEEKAGYKYYVLVLIFVHYTLNYMDRQLIAILAIPIQNELNLTDFQLGLLGGFSFALFYSTFAIPIALWADRSNRKNILAAAIGLWSLFTAFCGMATNFVQLFLFRLGVGIGEAGGVAPAYSILSDYFKPHQRGRAMGVISSGVPIGSALGLVVGGILADVYGWRFAFIALGLAGVLIAPLLWRTIKEPEKGRYDPVVTQKQYSFSETLKHLMGCPSFWYLSLGMATGAMVLYGFGFWLPAFFQRSHALSLQQTAWLFGALVLVGGLLGSFLGGWLGDKLGPSKVANYAYIPSVAYLIGLPLLIAALWVDSLPMAFILFVFPQACGLIGIAPVVVAIQNLGPPGMRSTLFACYLFLVNLIGLGLGATVLGALSDFFAAQFAENSLRYSLLICAGVLYPAVSLLYIIGGKRLEKDWYRSEP